MADVLEILYNNLKEIRTYLVKIGTARRQGSISSKKLNEARLIYEEYSSVLLSINVDIEKGNIRDVDKVLIEKFRSDFQILYDQIVDLCSQVTDSLSLSEKVEKMETFNLKVALSLLPVIDNTESSIKQLIDNIQYYDSILTEKTCKNNLIQFVLKSRLSQNAKLRLKSNYASVDELICDLRRELLPLKSPIAIQNQLQQFNQNNLSIEDYGKKLSELFVDLTISQAKGDPQSYKVLKPLNEKFVIKKFADGLRNRRLSTIIAARNYESIKDAIQAARDEEISMFTTSSSSGEVLGMYSYKSRPQYYHGSRSYYNGSYVNGRPMANSSVRRGNPSVRGGAGAQQRQQSRGYRPQRGRGAPHRGRSSFRGKSYYRNYSNQGVRHTNQHCMILNEADNDKNENEFFRD